MVTVATAVEAWVADEGPGVPREGRSKLFAKFGSLAERGRVSTGLGLYFCRMTLEQWGASIDYEERPGRPGALFRIRLRRVRAAKR